MINQNSLSWDLSLFRIHPLPPGGIWRAWCEYDDDRVAGLWGATLEWHLRPWYAPEWGELWMYLLHYPPVAVLAIDPKWVGGHLADAGLVADLERYTTACNRIIAARGVGTVLMD